MYAEQLDSDFLGNYSGTIEGQISPWSGLIIKSFNTQTGKWEETGIRQILKKQYQRQLDGTRGQ